MDLSTLKDFYAGKRVVVTGHTGFKGTWLCHILESFGAKIYGYSIAPEDLSLFNLTGIADKISSKFADIADLKTLSEFCKEANPDIILHLAAQPIVRLSYEDPVGTYTTNVIGTVNILESARCCKNVRSILNVTTDKVYLNREWEWGYRENERLDGYDPYSNSKSCSELVTWTYKRSFFNQADSAAISTARAGNVIGGGDFAKDRIIPDCVRAAIDNKKIIIRNPDSTRPYQHVLEPLFAYLMIAKSQYEKRELSGAYNVGPDDTDCYTTSKLVATFVRNWDEGLKWESRPSDGPHEANFLKLDNSKLKKTFGWNSVWNLDKAIEKTVEWTKAWQSGENPTDVIYAQISEYIENSLK